MDKKKKNIYYIAAAVVIVVVLIAVFMRKPAEVTPEVTPEVEEEVPEEVVPEIPEPVAPTEVQGEVDMITQAACADGKIIAVLTNMADETVTIGTDLIVMIRAMPVREGLGCDKTELAPGDSTTCTSLNGRFPVVSGENMIAINGLGAKRAVATVICE